MKPPITEAAGDGTSRIRPQNRKTGTASSARISGRNRAAPLAAARRRPMFQGLPERSVRWPM